MTEALSVKTVVDKEEWITYYYWPINCAVMGFKVYEIMSIPLDESSLEYRVKNSDSNEFTQDIGKAEVLFSGDIKFDGCINVIFDSQDDCMPHFCGNPARMFKVIFDRLYTFAAELMPEHKDYLLK